MLRATEILNWILRLEQHEISAKDRAALVGLLDLWIIMVSTWFLDCGLNCALDLARSLPDCCAEEYHGMVFLVKDIRLHLERWSQTRVHELRLKRLMVLAMVSKGWNVLISRRLIIRKSGANRFPISFSALQRYIWLI